MTGIELGESRNILDENAKSGKKVIGSLAVVKLAKAETFFEKNLVKNLFENVLELCKKKDEKYANLKVRNFVDEVVYDPKFIEINFKYPLSSTDDNRAELASAASRWSEEKNDEKGSRVFGGRGGEFYKPNLKDLKNSRGGIGDLDLQDYANSRGEIRQSISHNSQSEFSQSNSQDSRTGLADLDLNNADNSESEFNQANSQNSRTGIADLDSPNSHNSQSKFSDPNSANKPLPLRSIFNSSNPQELVAELDNTNQSFTAIHNANNNTGFIDGNNYKLQLNDLKSVDSQDGVLSAFSAAVKKTNKYETGAGNQYSRKWCEKAA
jgi:hypothetical protein